MIKIFYSILALVAGMALTLQVGLNGVLRDKIANPVAAAFISFFVGTVVLGLCLLQMGNFSFSRDLLTRITLADSWIFLGGVLGAFYIFSTIYGGAQLSFSVLFSLVICGQLILSVIFDHFGILSPQIHPITWERLVGIGLLLLGVGIIQNT